MSTLKPARVAASAYDKQLLIITYGLVLRSLNAVKIRACLMEPVRVTLLLFLNLSRLTSIALEREPSYSNRKEPVLWLINIHFHRTPNPLTC